MAYTPKIMARVIKPSPPAYAAIDLGTNSCRLLIAQKAEKGLRIVDAFSNSVKLGENINKTAFLSDEAQKRTINSLNIIKNKVKKHNVVKIRSVATAACRQASNGTLFLERVKRETGLDFEIIDENEEARLAFFGCADLCNKDSKHSIIFDIGGGSTQLILQKDKKIIDIYSIPYGVVTLTDYINKTNLSTEEFEYYSLMIKSHIEKFALKNNAKDVQLIGSSGTITTLTALCLGHTSYQRDLIDGTKIDRGTILTVTQRLAEMTEDHRTKYPCIGKERAHLMMAGCVILNAICKLWHTEIINVADRGIREGLLLQLIKEQGTKYDV